MRAALLVLVLLLVTACSSSARVGVDSDNPPPPVLKHSETLQEGIQRREELGSCYATFDDVVAAWEVLVGPLPAECRSLADGYEVRLVPTVPCTAPGGAQADGCAVLEQRTVYLLEDRSPAGQVYVSAHEWVHVLADCAEGDSDHGHRDTGLWSLEDGVLGLAVDDPPVGPCLEAVP